MKKKRCYSNMQRTSSGALRELAMLPEKTTKSGDFRREAQATESKSKRLGSKRGFKQTSQEKNLPMVLSKAG